MKQMLLIGFGAMGRAVMRELRGNPYVRVRYVLERAHRVPALNAELGTAWEAVGTLDAMARLPDFAVECAGHEALVTLVPPLLCKGVRTIVASVGALAQPGLPERLEKAALEGGTQLKLIAGALAGIDALSAARRLPLSSVRYVGRKPPLSWIGTPAEARIELRTLEQPAVIFEGDARSAARSYPKNANVAAMVALAGVGMERTHVTLLADPTITRNTHNVSVRGEFGEMEITLAAQPLAENPKTAALAALSIVRAILNEVEPIAI
jgi:aspartate dehydrogenase